MTSVELRVARGGSGAPPLAARPKIARSSIYSNLARFEHFVFHQFSDTAGPRDGAIFTAADETDIVPKKEGRKREISNESARGWSLREANV